MTAGVGLRIAPREGSPEGDMERRKKHRHLSPQVTGEGCGQGANRYAVSQCVRADHQVDFIHQPHIEEAVPKDPARENQDVAVAFLPTGANPAGQFVAGNKGGGVPPGVVGRCHEGV